jgi:hypothetical protein
MADEEQRRFVRFSTGCDRMPLIDNFALDSKD